MIMKMKFMGILSIVLIVCSMICGAWIYFNPGQGDVKFHAGLSSFAMAISIVSLVLYMARK